jgi:hypothetical protein
MKKGGDCVCQLAEMTATESKKRPITYMRWPERLDIVEAEFWGSFSKKGTNFMGAVIYKIFLTMIPNGDRGQ